MNPQETIPEIQETQGPEFTRKQLRILHGLSAVLPIFILGTMFALHGVFPFGTRQILVTDFWQQYFPFISDYWHRLRGGGSFLWSWTAGGGHDYIAHIAYYMASPFNLLAALFPHSWLREVLTVFLLFKLGLAGFFMSLFLRFALKKVDVLLPAFSTFYALCAFVLGYYWNIMWMDTFAVMPLVILGVYFLVTQGKYKVYIASLGAAILFNFYIGVFVCIFVAITFFAFSFFSKISLVDFIQRLGIVAGATVVALGISAVMVLPTYSALGITYRSSSDFPSFMFIRSFVYVLGNFIAFTPPTSMDGLPNLYSGMLSVMLIPVFLTSGKISVKEKVAYMAILVFLIFSVNVNVLDFIWNAFIITNMLPFRFSFIVSFVTVVMAYRGYTLLDKVSIWDVLAMAIGAVVFLLMAFIGPQENIHIALAGGVAGAYIIIFMVLFFIGRQGQGEDPPSKKKKAPWTKWQKIQGVKMILFIVVLVEIVGSAYNGVATVRTTDRVSFPLQNEQIQNLLDQREPQHDADFFRTEFSTWWSTNDPSLYSFDGISFFSSMANVGMSRFMAGMGLRAWDRGNSYSYAETTPLNNAILNMRYLISRDGRAVDQGYFWDVVAEDGNALLLQNNRYLPLGFMVDPALANFVGDEHNPFNAQNNFFRMATGLSGDLFDVIDIIHVGHTGYFVTRSGLGIYNFSLNAGYDSGSFRFNYEMPVTGLMYTYMQVPHNTDIWSWRVTTNRNTLHNIDMRRPYIFFAGGFEAGELVSFEADSSMASGSMRIFVGILNEALFEEGFHILNAQTLELTHFSDMRVTGTVTATQPGLLYTSIPHGNNWRVFVNGTREDIVDIGGALAGVMLPAGTHTVEFRFHNRSFNLGLAITLVSLAILAALIWLDRKKGICPFEVVYSRLFATRESSEKIKYLFFGGLTTILNWGVYSAMVALVGLSVTIGNIIAWFAAITFAFLVNRFYVFQLPGFKAREIFQQASKFIAMRLITGIMEIVLVPTLFFLGLNQAILGVEGFAAKLFVSIFVVIMNYVLSKNFVFK